jgi:hypothetical protein
MKLLFVFGPIRLMCDKLLLLLHRAVLIFGRYCFLMYKEVAVCKCTIYLFLYFRIHAIDKVCLGIYTCNNVIMMLLL